jgi:pSer/pThr/pTyr-binding forkhead associated (FHA) protein
MVKEVEVKTQLIVEHGNKEGKVYDLKNSPVVLGSDANITITITGEFVDSTHAILEKRDDGIWMIRNKSIHGTLVNGQHIDLESLANEDTIQIGSETLFKFVEVQVKQRRKNKKSKNPDDKSGDKKSNKLMVGLGIYLMIMLVVGVFLSGGGKKVSSPGDGISAKKFLLSISAKQLKNCIVDKSDQTGQFKVMIDHTDFASIYHRLQTLDVVEDEEEIDLLLGRLSEKLIQHYNAAWSFEGQLQLNKAGKEYRQMTYLIPDFRCSVTYYALKKIEYLKAKLSKDEN